jgi:GTP-binding protein
VTTGEAPDEYSYVVADIPGLIEGASAGHGLGTQFLRHIERTRLLLHVIDVSDASGRPDPTQDFKVIMNELETWGTGLEQKPMIVVASKIDVANAEKLGKLKRFASRLKLPFMAISAVTGEGIEKLKYSVAERVREIRAKGPEAPADDTQSLPA